MFRRHHEFRLGSVVRAARARDWFGGRRLLLIALCVALIGGVVPLIFYINRASAAYTCLNGGDHGGVAWDPATDCPGGIAGNHTNIGALTINVGETATVQAYTGTQYGSVQISASTINISGTLTANGKGYAGSPANSSSPGSGPGGGGGGGSSSSGGGGGYGGYGGFVNVGAAGVPNGSYSVPTSMGSGGGGGAGAAGGAGGGAVELTATGGTVTISGTVTANGAAGSNCGGAGGAGGAGGSIYLTTGTFAGGGSLSANGGGAGACDGGGSGGRVSISYSSVNSYSGSVSILGGSAGASGSSGTAIFVNSTTNDLYINNSQIWHANPSFEGQSFTYNNVTVSNSATWTWNGYYTTNSNGVGITFNAANFTINSGSSISADGQGYAGGPATSSTAGSGPGGGGGGSTGSGGGGGYGGAGGFANNGAAGVKYGSYSAPVDLGSGGGGGNNEAGGAGGGAIKILASGTLTVSGVISANGVSIGACSGTGGAGGAGGSIYLKSKAFAGAGSISAKGGDSGSCDASGGGGRIAAYYSSANTFSGTLSAVPGSAGSNGTAGTCIVVNSTTNDLYITTSQTWNANPSLEGSTFTYNNVTVSNSATWTWNGYYTTNTNGVGIAFNVHNFTVTSGSKLSADGQGYAGGPATSSTAGSGPGGGGGGSTGSGGGGGYGGAGGFVNVGAAGITYGSSTAPVDLGSGGGGGNNEAGGAGGGAIKIAATGTVNISGTISANGGNVGACSSTGGAGGSGGSIYITTATLSGAGVLTVNGGNSGSCDAGGGAGRLAVYYTENLSWTGTALDPTHAATPGSAGVNGAAGTVYVTHTSGRSITMSSSVPGATSVTYEVSIDVNAGASIGGIVVDICDDTPVFGAASCAYPSNFDWGGATPSLTVNGGIGSGWVASGVQGGAAAGKSQVLELSNATPQTVTSSNSIDFSISGVTNPAAGNHTFYARVVTFDTSAHMTSQYTVSGTTRSGALTNEAGNYGFALSTGLSGVSLQFTVLEGVSMCVSGSAIGSNCSGLTTPNITLGHVFGTGTVLDSSAVDTAQIYAQVSTNAQTGVLVRLKDTNGAASCGGLSVSNGATCGIPAVNTVCGGSCSATAITAGTAAIGLCVAPGTANITAQAPYNGANCGTTGTTYGLDDATVHGVRSIFGSPVFSSSGPVNQENSTLTFAATASAGSPAGIYTATYSLIATGTY